MEILFDFAKHEYNTEDNEGKNRLVYSYFGLAIYYGQCLEESLSIMLYTDRIFKNKVKTNEDVNEIIDSIENSKKTMGHVINEVKQNYSLTTSIEEQLNIILYKRNYLVHKYFKLHVEKFYSEVGQLEMIKYFCDFIDESKHIECQLKVYYTQYTKLMGLTEERIEQMMIEMKKAEIRRAATDIVQNPNP